MIPATKFLIQSDFQIFAAGDIKNNYDKKCIDSIENHIILKPCHGHGLGQYWMLTKTG